MVLDGEAPGAGCALGCDVAGALPFARPKAAKAIHTAIATIVRFSVSDRKPGGTLLEPPTQAHFDSRLSTQTAFWWSRTDR